MKSNGRWLLASAAILIWVMGGVITMAGEAAAGPHFVWAFDDEVKPEHMDAYLKAKIASAKLCTQHKFDYSYLTFAGDFHVYTYGIFNSFAQLDGMPQQMEAWNEKTGGKSEEIDKQIGKCVSHCATSIAVFRPDLSYMPEAPAFVVDLSKPFYQSMDVYHIKGDKYKEAEAAAKRFKALDEKQRSPMGYLVYERICGPGVPAFLVVAHAEDEAAFASLVKKMEQNPDPEKEQAMAETVHLITKMETFEGTYVPEASYVPEGTF